MRKGYITVSENGNFLYINGTIWLVESFVHDPSFYFLSDTHSYSHQRLQWSSTVIQEILVPLHSSLGEYCHDRRAS
jgi:hypothetical protein